MLFILSLFLLCGIVFTLFLVAITVRDARRIAGRELTEKEKDRIALEFARPEFASAVTSIQGHPLKDLIEVNIDLLLHLLFQQFNHGAEGYM